MNNEKKLQKLKETYDNVEIPKELSAFVKNGIIQGKEQIKQNKQKNKRIKWICSAAAIFMAFFISVNTIPSFANTLHHIPGIGTLVQVLQFEKGSSHGGTITDGTDVSFIALQKKQNSEAIIINFAEENIPKDLANYFKVDYSESPYTLTFSISGARHFSAKKDLQTLKESNLIKDAYEIITLDDSMVRFSITLNKPFAYEVREYKDPAQVVVSLLPKNQVNSEKIYSIRSNSYDYGEQLGSIEEALFEFEGKRILKDEKGKFCVEAKYFTTMDDAINKLEQFKEKYPVLSDFHIEERNPLDLPKYIES